MNKIRTWFNKAKKEVGNQLMIRPSACHDVTVVMEMPSSTQRDLDRGLIGSDLIQNTRLSMLRSLLQVEHVKGDRTQTEPTSPDVISLTPVVGGATDTGSCDITSVSYCSLPSSPHLGGRRRLPCSLPCSPLLGGRCWRSSPASPSPPPAVSRLLVEAALQRSKIIRPTPPCSPQVSRWGKTEEEEWSDEEVKDKQVNIAGIRLSDTVIFRPMTSPSVCGREEEQEEEEEEEKEEEEEQEEEESDLLCLDSERWRCSLTPCICLRCPSAPPYEAENVQTEFIFSCGDQKLSEGSIQLSQRTDIQSLPRDGAPQLGEGSRLYPSLSLWRITADSQTSKDTTCADTSTHIGLQFKQTEANRDVNSFKTTQSCFYGNTDDHLQQLCEKISGELQTLCSADLSVILKKVFDSTTCSKRTACPVESCSLCSDKPSVQIMKHLCRNCDQVFCSRCLSHFASLLRIHQFSQTAAV